MLYDRLIIDGTPLDNYATITEVWGGLNQSGRRGSNLVVPGRDGEVFIPKARDTSTITFGLVLTPVDPETGVEVPDPADGQLDTNYRALTRLVAGRTDRPLTVVRQLVGLPEQHTATAELARPLEPVAVGYQAIRLTLELRILTGLWYSVTETEVDDIDSDPATITSDGTATTTKITVFFAGPGTITNSTLGLSLTSTTETIATVDVQNMATDHGSVTGRFALAPGENTITVAGTTASIAWQDAWL